MIKINIDEIKFVGNEINVKRCEKSEKRKRCRMVKEK
jgi:hypothetical protein